MHWHHHWGGAHWTGHWALVVPLLRRASLAVATTTRTRVALVHDVKQLVKDLGHVRMTSHVLKLEGTNLLGLVLLKVSLVDCIFNLKLPLLLDLIVVNDEALSLESHSV